MGFTISASTLESMFDMVTQKVHQFQIALFFLGLIST